MLLLLTLLLTTLLLEYLLPNNLATILLL